MYRDFFSITVSKRCCQRLRINVSVFGYVFILNRDCSECIPLGVELDAVRGAVGKDESEREG